jgi:hypothetical protein
MITAMSDDEKPKPLDDLKQGLGLLFRAAKGAAEKLPVDKVENVAKDAAKEMGRAVETIGDELDKLYKKATGSEKPAAKADEAGDGQTEDEKKKEEPPQHYDDAYAPEPPPKGPRIG